MDLIILSQNHVLVRNPRKMLITPDDNGDLHICADLADGAIPHLVKLTKAGYTAEQLVKGYFRYWTILKQHPRVNTNPFM